MTPDFIFEIENSLDPKLCQKMIELFEADPHKAPGITGNGLDPGKQSTDLVLSGQPLWKDVVAQLTRHLYTAASFYAEQFDVLTQLKLYCNCFQIQRTRPGEGYIWHTDVGARSVSNRQYVFIWYLNDVESGGETQFKYIPRKITPKQGKLALFPAGWTHAHRGNTPIGGDKYICTGWVCLV